MEAKFRHLDEVDFRLYKAMQEWHNRIGDMLAYVNDKLVPHGFDEIVKDDFAALRQMRRDRFKGFGADSHRPWWPLQGSFGWGNFPG
jgi:hypothetical protein